MLSVSWCSILSFEAFWSVCVRGVSCFRKQLFSPYNYPTLSHLVGRASCCRPGKEPKLCIMLLKLLYRRLNKIQCLCQTSISQNGFIGWKAMKGEEYFWLNFLNDVWRVFFATIHSLKVGASGERRQFLLHPKGQPASFLWYLYVSHALKGSRSKKIEEDQRLF